MIKQKQKIKIGGKTPGAGRKTVMTPHVLALFTEAFMLAFTDEEACLHAGVSTDALYDYCRAHPDFARKKEEYKKSPNLRVKRLIQNALNEGDLNTAKWWAERKMKEEFSTRTEQTGKDGEALVPVVNIVLN